MELPYEKRFHFHDGTSIGSLEELMRKLASISYVEFYHHVNPDKNDFANWVLHVLREEQLAAELEKVSSIVETIEIINDHLHPRPLEAPRSDAQSAIEHQVFGDQYAVVEETPAEREEPADFTVIQETIESAPEAAKPEVIQSIAPADADRARMIVKDFLFGFLFGLLIGALLGRVLP